jgi:fumarate reductase flavoprotein subunit
VTVIIDDARRFDIEVPVLVIGAGGCGLVAALAARDAGANVMVLERDKYPAGSTALSSGFIPAAFTRFQQAAGVVDSPEAMAADIQRKNGNGADPAVVNGACHASGSTIEWLADAHQVPFVLVSGFTYPGHSALRIHAVPERTGLALMNALRSACEAASVDIVTSAWVVDLIARSDRRVVGVRIERPGGHREELGCKALVLACSGFGGNPQMVHEYLPEIADAVYFGHVGNQGDAIRWGRELGAVTRDLSAYQGHGSVATPHGILITWALMMEGAIQVNALGKRFSNEQGGYSEQCLPVLRQPGGTAWNVYDDRVHRLGLEFDDYRKADSLGAVKSASSVDALAFACGLPLDELARTITEVHRSIAGRAADRFGRSFVGQSAWKTPLHAVKVTGALFHTQGGLEIDGHARVVDLNRQPLPNLFAGGGAARGLSGSAVWGYLSGNGLLSAVVLGRLAGASAAAVAGRLSADSDYVAAG